MTRNDVKRGRSAQSVADPRADLAAGGADLNDQSGKEGLPPLVPPVGHPQRAAALEFLRLPLTASDDDVRRRLGELARVSDDNVSLNAQGLPLAPEETWEPDPAWQEYYGRFIEGLVDWESHTEFLSVDPVPYLRELLARLPGIEQRFPGTDARLRPDIERGIANPTFGLRLLMEDDRFDGILPRRALTFADFQDPTPRENAYREVLGPPVLIVEEVVRRYRCAGHKDGKLVAKRLSKPVTQEELVPILESRTYRAHCARRLRMPVADVTAELRRALDGEARLVGCVAADVRWQPPHWLGFKSRAARQRDRTTKTLIAKIERRFRPHALGRAGRPVGSKNRPRSPSSNEQGVRELVPRLRAFIREAKRLCREGRNPNRAFGQVVDLLTAPPSAKAIEAFCVEVRPPRRMRKSPEEIVRWVVAKHLGIGLVAAKNLIKRPR
jgi:hypothetical protein